MRESDGSDRDGPQAPRRGAPTGPPFAAARPRAAARSRSSATGPRNVDGAVSELSQSPHAPDDDDGPRGRAGGWREVLENVRQCFADVDGPRGGGRFGADVVLSTGMLAVQQALRGLSSHHTSPDGAFGTFRRRRARGVRRCARLRDAAVSRGDRAVPPAPRANARRRRGAASRWRGPTSSAASTTTRFASSRWPRAIRRARPQALHELAGRVVPRRPRTTDAGAIRPRGDGR